jgi:hypothetical protein
MTERLFGVQALERVLKIEAHSFSLAPQFIAGLMARFHPKPFQRFSKHICETVETVFVDSHAPNPGMNSGANDTESYFKTRS